MPIVAECDLCTERQDMESEEEVFCLPEGWQRQPYTEQVMCPECVSALAGKEARE